MGVVDEKGLFERTDCLSKEFLLNVVVSERVSRDEEVSTFLDLEFTYVWGETAEEDLAALFFLFLVSPCGWYLARLVSKEVSLRAVVVCDPSRR